MDDLEFRKRVISDPQSNDPALLEAVSADATRQALLKEMQALDHQLTDAFEVPIPSGLSDKLLAIPNNADISNTSTDNNVIPFIKKPATRFHVAIAASIALVFGMSFQFIYSTPKDMAQYTLSHFYHEPAAIQNNQRGLTLASVNESLSGYGLNLEEMGVKVVYAKDCYLQGINSMHLVFQDPQGKLYTLFVMPNKQHEMPMVEKFSDDKYHGKSYRVGDTDLLIMTTKGQEIETFKQKLDEKIVWQI